MAPHVLFAALLFSSPLVSSIVLDLDPPPPSKATCESAWYSANSYVNEPDRCDLYANITASNARQCALFKYINLGSAYRTNFYYYFDVMVRRAPCGSLEYAGHTRPRVNETEFEFTANDTVCVSGASLFWFVSLTRWDPYNTRYPDSVVIQSGIEYGCQPSCCTTSGWANDAMEYAYDVSFETTQIRNNSKQWRGGNYSCDNSWFNTDPTLFSKRCQWIPHITESPTKSPTNNPTESAVDTVYPTVDPTDFPTNQPSIWPSMDPTYLPTNNPVTDYPSVDPTYLPTAIPSIYPSVDPTSHRSNEDTQTSSSSLDMSTSSDAAVMTTSMRTSVDRDSQSADASPVQWWWALLLLLVGFILGGLIMSFYCYCHRKRKQRKNRDYQGQKNYEDVALVELDEFNQVEGQSGTVTATFM